MMKAVQHNGMALGDASEELQSTRGIVMEAVQQYGLALQFASKELQSDRGVVMQAVQQNGLAKRRRCCDRSGAAK